MDNNKDIIQGAVDHFASVLQEQLERLERIKNNKERFDITAQKKLRIGFAGGDGIGPVIADETKRLLEKVLKKKINSGAVELKNINGLTIENRFKAGRAIPDDVLAEIKKCHVILKGPMETPQKGDPRGNLESANICMRRELDLFANIRPVRIPEKGIDWTFFRENTEGAYVLGNQGIEVNEDLAVDFKVITSQGTERIVRAACEFARKMGKKRVTVVTKANVIKTTDGKFREIAFKVAEDYPDLEFDEWYIDIMTAKLIDPARQKDFQVLVLPNLYGDILTDEAAQLQGGVGTAGSANIGDRYAMFEAIHGSGNRMVREGRAQYADPSSMMRALAMLLDYIGAPKLSKRLVRALDVCALSEKKMVITGKPTGVTAKVFTDYVIETFDRTL